MALSKTITLVDNFNESITFNNAYVKVVQASITKETCAATYKILKQVNGQELTHNTVCFSFDLEGPNPIKQAYLHLKTLPEFSNATDC